MVSSVWNRWTDALHSSNYFFERMNRNIFHGKYFNASFSQFCNFLDRTRNCHFIGIKVKTKMCELFLWHYITFRPFEAPTKTHKNNNDYVTVENAFLNATTLNQHIIKVNANENAPNSSDES